jgi:hypothetical protein
MSSGWADAGERVTDGSTRVGRQVGGGGSGAFRTDSFGGHVPGHAEHRCPTGVRGAGTVLPLERGAVGRSSKLDLTSASGRRLEITMSRAGGGLRAPISWTIASLPWREYHLHSEGIRRGATRGVARRDKALKGRFTVMEAAAGLARPQANCAIDGSGRYWWRHVFGGRARAPGGV